MPRQHGFTGQIGPPVRRIYPRPVQRPQKPRKVGSFLMNLSAGQVALVGAGPGDPGLLTLAGASLLAQADVVVYDALANPRLLGHAPRARHIFAGKRAAHHSMTQDEINALLVGEAKAGNRVVRLKGGDPFVFGRGGEEAEALVEANIGFVVVPGITAAVAAAAYAGIPVTHRDLNTSFTLVTGHEKERGRQEPEAAARQELDAAEAEATDWSALAKLPLLCLYMGIRSLPGIAEKLISHGMSPDTPAASVQWGTTPKQKVVVATIATIARENERQGLGSPAITYVGEAVRLREKLAWFDGPTTRPLLGKTIVVTRTRQQASELTQKLEGLGANVIEAPTIRIEPPADPRSVQVVLHRLRDVGPAAFDAVMFTSANGVAKTRDALDALGLDARIFADIPVAAVGPATAAACLSCLAIRPDCVPEQFNGDGLASDLCAKIEATFGKTEGRRVLLLRADIGRASIVDRLRNAGLEVEDVAVYETRPVERLPDELIAALDAGEVDAVTFTSGSTARNFAKLVGDINRLGSAKLVSIGPQASAAMREWGLRVAAEAEAATLDSLVDAVSRAIGGSVG